MLKTTRYQAFFAHFSQHQPNPTTELNYSTPFELLIAVILSAQCTDKRVNQVTPALFATFPTAYHIVESNFDTLFPYIRSISYPNSKTKYLLKASDKLTTDFGGEIPDNTTLLQQLPGVGRKTANVVVSVLYQKPTIPVDTHVFRVAKRLGLVSEKANTPLAVEKELMKHTPKTHFVNLHHWLVLHGRYICTARKPKCSQCPLTHFCRYFRTSS